MLKIKFGINHDEYDALLRQQEGLCAVCRQPEKAAHHSRWGSNGKLRALAVDHDHVTGKVRGLLCSSCNGALGQLRESVEIIERLRAYLLKVRQ